MLDLTTLEQRRKREDLIQIYKMINGQENIGIKFASSAFSLRGYNFETEKGIDKNSFPRYNFLTNRILNHGNYLSEVLVKSNNFHYHHNRTSLEDRSGGFLYLNTTKSWI